MHIRCIAPLPRRPGSTFDFSRAPRRATAVGVGLVPNPPGGLVTAKMRERGLASAGSNVQKCRLQQRALQSNILQARGRQAVARGAAREVNPNHNPFSG